MRFGHSLLFFFFFNHKSLKNLLIPPLTLQMLAATSDDKEKADAMKTKGEMNFTKTTTTVRRGESGLCELESESSTDKPFELAFNIHYLMDAISTMRSVCDEAVICYSATATAITMRPKDKEYPLSVVMPLRV